MDIASPFKICQLEDGHIDMIKRFRVCCRFFTSSRHLNVKPLQPLKKLPLPTFFGGRVKSTQSQLLALRNLIERTVVTLCYNWL